MNKKSVFKQSFEGTGSSRVIKDLDKRGFLAKIEHF